MNDPVPKWSGLTLELNDTSRKDEETRIEWYES